jgi:predicted type IV restriction endonuclease
MMVNIHFEKFPAVISGNKVFDPIRKKWLEALPEEIVRQHLLQYLLLEKKYPASLIKLEHPHQLNDLNKRSDVVVYNRNGKPGLLIECKAPDVTLNDDVLLQVLRYNMHLGASYIVLCNGLQTFCFHQGTPLQEIPDFELL